MPAAATAPHRVRVLGSFSLTALSRTGQRSAVPLGADARRVVAYLAVHPRPQRRGALAADLWPGMAVGAAMRLLDEAVAAVDVPGLLVHDSDGALALADDVAVDLAAAMRLVRELPDATDADPELDLLSADLLPGWTAAWLAVERERFRQLRMHALEQRAERLVAAGRVDDAVALARSVVHSAPSRESARRVLIEAFLALGDIASAVAEADGYQELLRSSVGSGSVSGLDALLPPSPVWAVGRARNLMPRSAVRMPGLRTVRVTPGGPRRLAAGGASR